MLNDVGWVDRQRLYGAACAGVCARKLGNMDGEMVGRTTTYLLDIYPSCFKRRLQSMSFDGRSFSVSSKQPFEL